MGTTDFTLASHTSDLPYDDATSDSVISAGVLENENRNDERASVEGITRVLKPEGTFVCAHLPNRGTWIERTSRRMNGSCVHPYRSSRRDLDSLLTSSGLELVERSRCSTGQPLPVLLPRTGRSSFGGGDDAPWC